LAGAPFGSLPIKLMTTLVHVNPLTQQSLSTNPQFPCALIEISGCRILLDCAIPMTNRLDSCPIDHEQINWSEIDAILISSYESSTFLGFIASKTLFKGRILGTLPTLEFSKFH
jgi:Cft2 family RNA processing exonuclease